MDNQTGSPISAGRASTGNCLAISFASTASIVVGAVAAMTTTKDNKRHLAKNTRKFYSTTLPQLPFLEGLVVTLSSLSWLATR